MKISYFNENKLPETHQKEEMINFLFNHLEQYRDNIEDIEKAVDFALKISPSFGGFILMSHQDDQLTGAVVVNQTGMEGYIPENILVYIATHKDFRGKGIGKKLLEEALKKANGNVALHVEPENPARFLYEKMGFTSKYAEMRYIKD